MLRKTIISTKGQTIVETALILPIIVLILTGIIDFGILFRNYTLITSISREAARLAAIGSTDEDIRDIADNMASVLNSDRMQIIIYPSESSRHRGKQVTITVKYDNNIFTPIISMIMGDTIKLTAKTTMRVE